MHLLFELIIISQHTYGHLMFILKIIIGEMTKKITLLLCNLHCSSAQVVKCLSHVTVWGLLGIGVFFVGDWCLVQNIPIPSCPLNRCVIKHWPKFKQDSRLMGSVIRNLGDVRAHNGPAQVHESSQPTKASSLTQPKILI